MSWGGYIPGDLINEIDWCRFNDEFYKREESMSNELFYKAAYLVQDHQSFDSWEYQGVGRRVSIPDLGVVTLVEIQSDDNWDQVSHYYGEGPQGYEGELGLVFKVETPKGETVYLKKKGTKDSYGSESWDGKIVQVKQTTKTVTVFDEV